MSATTRINLVFLSCAIFVTSAYAYNCYVASSSDANFPSGNQWTWGYNCTACVRGKYVYTNGQSGSIWIWGCMTGSTGMVVSQGLYPGSWGAPPSSWGGWGGAPSVNLNGAPNVNWGGVASNPWSTLGGIAQWAGGNTWAGAGNPWSTWGAAWGAPATPFANAYANMCVDGSFDGYSNSLGAYAYMCVCCGDACNQNLRCKTFNGANSHVAFSSSLATLLALTFATVNVLHA